MLNPRAAALIIAILGAAIFRLIPHPPNFSPIAAMALFGGAYLPRRWMGFVAPLGALLLSDLVLGFYSGMAIVYGSVALIVVMGWLLASKRSPARVGLVTFAGSVLFYLLTNFGVWASGTLYPKTAEGLLACYVAALPFFQNSVAGDLFFAALLFGGFALAERKLPLLREPARPQAA